MLGALEIELGKGQITSIVVHAGNFQALTVAAYASRLKHIIPALGIAMHREGAALAEGTPHTQLALAQLVALSTVHEEMRLGTNTFCEVAPKVSNVSMPFLVHIAHPRR